MQVTIEGVVSTDVCKRGEQHTVEWTKHVRQLTRRGLVKVVQWHHPEPEVEPTHADGPVKFDEGGALPEPVASSEEPVLSAEEIEAVTKPKRSRRRQADAEE